MFTTFAFFIFVRFVDAWTSSSVTCTLRRPRTKTSSWMGETISSFFSMELHISSEKRDELMAAGIFLLPGIYKSFWEIPISLGPLRRKGTQSRTISYSLCTTTFAYLYWNKALLITKTPSTVYSMPWLTYASRQQSHVATPSSSTGPGTGRTPDDNWDVPPLKKVWNAS